MTTWPLDTTRPLAFFGSEDGKTWTRLAAVEVIDGNSFKAVAAFTCQRYIKIDYDDLAAGGEQAGKK